MDVAVIHAEGGKLADFQEGRARVEQRHDALARQQLAASRVPLARLGVAPERRFRPAGEQLGA